MKKLPQKNLLKPLPLLERVFVTTLQTEWDLERLDEELSKEILEHGKVVVEVWVETGIPY